MRRFTTLLVASALALGASSAGARDGDASGVALRYRTSVGLPNDLVLAGGRLLAATDTGLAVFDAGSLGAPQLIGRLSCDGPALDLVVSGQTAYVAAGEAGLRILDVSNPAQPVELGARPDIDARAVGVSGSRVVVGDGPTLRVFDVTDPVEPEPLGAVGLPGEATSLAVEAARAIVGFGPEVGDPCGLAIVNVANPSLAVLEGVLQLGAPVLSVATSGSLAFVGMGAPLAGALLVVDLSTPSLPAVVSRLSTGDAVHDVAVSGGIAHLAAGALGLVRVDVTEPGSPRWLDSVATGREAWCVAGAAPHVVVGERSSLGEGGLASIDVPPVGPGALTGRAAISEATGVAAQSGLGFLLNRSWLEVVDATADGPSTLATWTVDRPDFAALAVQLPLVAISRGHSVDVLELEGASSLRLRGSASLALGAASGLALADEVLVVATGRRVELYSTAAGGELPLLASVPFEGWVGSVAVQHDHAFVTAGETLHVLSIRSAASPALVGSLPLGHQLFDVDVREGLAAVAGLGATLQLVDVSVPSAPGLISTLMGPGSFAVSLGKYRAFVAQGEGGLLVVDARHPASPRIEAWHDTSGTARDVAHDGDTVLLATLGAQHWVDTCLTCATSCGLVADVWPAEASVCGESVTFEGGFTNLNACPEGRFDLQWYEDGAPIEGATAVDLVVPVGHASGEFDLTLAVTCPLDPACSSQADARLVVEGGEQPIVAPRSLRLQRTPAFDAFVWRFADPEVTGPVNVHRSREAVFLDPAIVDERTVVAQASGTLHGDTELPGVGGVFFYRVFAQANCSEQSVAGAHP